MDLARHPLTESGPALLLRGYGWLPDRWRRRTGDAVRTRLAGMPAVALRGPEAVRFVYDEDHVRRHGALPEPVRGTLFGKDAVHTLDGEAHRVRKAMFVSLLMDPSAIARLVDLTSSCWDAAVDDWTARGRVVLFDEASRVIAAGVTRWAQVPLPDDEVAPLARDLVALVDGFGSGGRRHWRARRARGRRQRWLEPIVEDVRAGRTTPPAGSVLDVVARHRDADGALLPPRVAAVEILNVLRPTVAVCWFVAYAAHALHRWPQHRDLLRTGDPEFAEAFVHEVRRFYPFAPFIGGTAVRDLAYRGETVPEGAMVLLDLYGQNHDEALFDDPYRFRPQRFLERPPAPDELIPQGGGDPRTNHRCPGEILTVELLRALSVRLAQLDYDVPEQDLRIPLRRLPTRVRSGVVIENVRRTGTGG